VKQTWLDQGETWVHEMQTPLGTIRQVHRQAEGPHRSRALTEHFVKDLESLRVLKYVVEATHYEPDYAPVEQALRETGDDGGGVERRGPRSVHPVRQDRTPGISTRSTSGPTVARKVDTLIRGVHAAVFLERIRVLAAGPADVIATGDNMDGATISPAIFQTTRCRSTRKHASW